MRKYFQKNRNIGLVTSMVILTGLLSSCLNINKGLEPQFNSYMPDSVGENESIIIIVREINVVGSMVNMPVDINGQRVAVIPHGARVVHVVPNGKQLIQVQAHSDPSKAVRLEFEANSQLITFETGFFASGNTFYIYIKQAEISSLP